MSSGSEVPERHGEAAIKNERDEGECEDRAWTALSFMQVCDRKVIQSCGAHGEHGMERVSERGKCGSLVASALLRVLAGDQSTLQSRSKPYRSEVRVGGELIVPASGLAVVRATSSGPGFKS